MNVERRADNEASLSVLNRPFSLHSCALPGYVIQANPYVASGDKHLLALIRRIARRLNVARVIYQPERAGHFEHDAEKNDLPVRQKYAKEL